MPRAWRDGRMGKDPATFWYQGEIGFFDNYVIPLAKKLKECNVFGVSSDEYISYALANREEWEDKGQLTVAELVQEAMKEYQSLACEADNVSGQKVTKISFKSQD